MFSMIDFAMLRATLSPEGVFGFYTEIKNILLCCDSVVLF